MLWKGGGQAQQHPLDSFWMKALKMGAGRLYFSACGFNPNMGAPCAPGCPWGVSPPTPCAGGDFWPGCSYSILGRGGRTHCWLVHPPGTPKLSPSIPSRELTGLCGTPPPHSGGDSPVPLVAWGRGGEEVGAFLGGCQQEGAAHPPLCYLWPSLAKSGPHLSRRQGKESHTPK